MKIGFSKGGILFNSKKLNPMNISLSDFGINTEEDYGIESDIEPLNINPSEILYKISDIYYAGTDNEDGINGRLNQLELLGSLFEELI